MSFNLAIPQTDPRAGYLACRAEIDEAIGRVLASGSYILGEEVAAFEAEFSAYLGVRFCVGVASGTDAVELALRACGIGVSDSVITVSHTSVATVAAIERLGAVPILVDIRSDTFTMDPQRLEEAIRHQPAGGPRIKAIVPVHLYGHPAEMAAIMDIAAGHQLVVVEDCAQAHGATILGRKVGTWGHLAAFSFYPTKNLAALGDGGAVVGNDSDLAERLFRLRQYGWRERFISAECGVSSRLDEIQAAILRCRLPHLEEDNAHRRHLAALYDRELATTGLILPRPAESVHHVYHQYVVRSSARDNLRAFLRENGIATAIHYPVPIHRQPAYEGRLACVPEGLPVTTQICDEVLSLPLYPQFNDEQVRQVGERIRTWSDRERGNG